MSNEIEQYKESISDRYIKDFKKELNFFQKAMILPIEKKMKEILKSDKKIDVNNLKDLEDLWFWRKVLWAKIWQKQLFEDLMTKTFNFLKEKQEKIIEAESAWRLQELSYLVINGKLDELDNLVTNTNPVPVESDENLNWDENSETPENWSWTTENQSQVNTEEQWDWAWENDNHSSEDWNDNRSTIDIIQDNSMASAGAGGAVSAATFNASMNTINRIAGRNLNGIEVSNATAKDLMSEGKRMMNESKNLLEQQMKTNPRMSRSMKKQFENSIKEFESAEKAMTNETIDAIKIWEHFWENLPESAIKNLKIDPKVAKQLKEIPDEEIVRLLNEAQDGKQLKTLLKETRNIDISEDAARMLKVAKNADEFKWITTIFKEIKWVQRFLRWLKWACMMSFLFLWFDIWAAIEDGKEADIIKEVNKERWKYQQQWAYVQLQIWIAWVLADALTYIALYAAIWSCGWWIGIVVGLVVWIIQMLATLALEDHYEEKKFYAQNRIDFGIKSRTYIKQSIVQLMESDRRDLSEDLKKEIRESRGPDSEVDTLEDAWEALIYQEERDEGGYYMIQQYYHSGKSEENFLKDLSEEEKGYYNEQKEELEWKIKVRMDYIKKYIKEDPNSPEYVSMKNQILENKWVEYVEQVLADSKVYAMLQEDIENPYIENYKSLDVAWYKEAYKTKLQWEYPQEFALFEKLSTDNPTLIGEILSWASILWNEISEFVDWSQDLYTQEEKTNITKNLDFVEKYYEYYNLGRPIEKIISVNGMLNNIDFAYVEQLLADNFESINKRPSWDQETALNYLYWSEYRNRMEAKYEVSDSLTENVLYSIAKEFHGYTWRNDTMELINFYNEWDKNSTWIYYDTCRRFNWDWWNDHRFTSDISTLDSMTWEEIYSTFKRWKLDSPMEVADDKLNAEYRKRIEEIILREAGYRDHKKEYEQKIIDFVKSNSIDGGYVEIPYDLMIEAKKAGIWRIENYLFKYKDGEIYAISCGDTVDDLLHFDKIDQKIKYEATTPLRNSLTEEENNLIKSVDNACARLSKMRAVEIDFWHDHTDELDVPVQLERIVSKKAQDWEKEKDMVYYMEPILAKKYLEEKSQEYYNCFDWLYRWLLTTITSYKVANDINDVWAFNSSLNWMYQSSILSINEKWEIKFIDSVPETIQKILPELFDYYKDSTSWKTISQLLHSENSEEKSQWQFLAMQIYTICMEEAVLDYNSNWDLVDFNVNWDSGLDINKVKKALDEKMSNQTFKDVLNWLSNMNTDNINVNEKGVREVSPAEKEFHSNIETATQEIINRTWVTYQDVGYDIWSFIVWWPAARGTRNAMNTIFHKWEILTSRMDLVDWGELRGDPTFLADTEQKTEWAVTWNLKTWWHNEHITICVDESWEKIKSVKVDWLNMEFTNIDEWFRIANLINWIKKNKIDNPKWKNASNRLWWKYDDYMWYDGKLDRNITGTTFNLVILSAPVVNQLYPSIKNKQEFIDYINTDRV